MKSAVPSAIAVQQVIDDVMRRDRGRLLAGLIARLGDFQLAQDALQEAAISALKHWGRSGVPHAPVAWLMRAGLNKGIDQLRTRQREGRKAGALGLITPDRVEMEIAETIPDERLRLIFTCCHPALEEKSRVALTLRTVCSLTTREIAAAFLDSEQTMGQRLSRAKAKIRAKGIGFQVPEPDQWSERLSTVLSTLYLIFTTGYVNEEAGVKQGTRDLCREAIYLARLLCALRPDDPEIEGALALMLLTESRRAARIGPDGAMRPIEDQDSSLWQHAVITEAQVLLAQAVLRRQPGAFQIKAAIADCHMMRPKPDWAQMALLYQALWRFEPTPVVALNQAVVMAELGQRAQALENLRALEGDLGRFQPWHAAMAHVLAQEGQIEDAQRAYAQAIKTAPNDAARRFLEIRLQGLSPCP